MKAKPKTKKTSTRKGARATPSAAALATQAAEVSRQIRSLRDDKKKEILQRFFKTQKGEYAEGDLFLGLTVPQTRKIAKASVGLSLSEIAKLLASPYHEERLCALLILTYQFPKATEQGKAKIFKFYLRNKIRVNNWDLVDVTAPHIVGPYLFQKRDFQPLIELSGSGELWTKRIAMISTQYFIRQNWLEPTYELADRLHLDTHDLMHKAVGWMLREAGKKDPDRLREFLRRRIAKLPRTCLRYAIEKFSARERALWLKMTG
jgi:3-methyladenine DNA glycosylase AlkD